MKQFILLMTCCLLVSSSFAQLQQNSTFLGATIGADINVNSITNKSSTYSLKPAAGYFITNKWMVGLSTDLAKTKTRSYTFVPTYNNGPVYVLADKTVNSISLGPFARYYVNLSPKFSFFTEGAVGYSYRKGKTEHLYDNGQSNVYEHPSDVTFETLYAKASPGVVFFASPKIGVELKVNVLSYTYGRGDNEYREPIFISPVERTQFKADFSLASTSVGVGFYF